MKKMISLLAAVIFIFILGTTAFAADYYVDEADMYISLPYDYDVIKPEMDKDVYNSMGYSDSYESAMSYLEENGFILYCNSWDGNSSVMGSIWEDYGINYASCTEAKLNEEKTVWRKVLVSDGTYTALEEEIISVGQNKFIRFLFEESSGNYKIMYIISYDRDLVFIEYVVTAEAYNDEFIAMAAESVESIVFDDMLDTVKPLQKEHYIPEIGAYVSLPEKYYVMTSEGYDDWFNENQTEEDIQEILDMNAEDNRFLAAIGDDVSHDISVYADEAEPGYDTEEAFFESAEEYYFGDKVIVQEKEIVKIGGTNYVYVSIKDKDDFTHASMYAALKDGKYICYLCNVSSGELTERLENELYSIVESTRYEAPGATESESVPEATEPTVVTDELLGFSMTVPKNWVMDETEDENVGDIHNYALHHSEDISIIITCTAMSVKAFASDLTFGQVELTEEDFGNQTVKDYADLLEVPEEAVTVKELGGNTYYFAEQEVSGVQVTASVIVKNGVYYMYFFSDTDKNPAYPVFEEFIANVEYTEPTIGSEGEEPTETAKLAKTVGTVLIVLVVIGIAAIALIVALIIIAVKKSKKKKQEAAASMPQPEEFPSSNGFSAPEGNNFCAFCGAKLNEDSRFCPKCGRPVNKE